jgi:hypothetical protein
LVQFTPPKTASATVIFFFARGEDQGAPFLTTESKTFSFVFNNSFMDSKNPYAPLLPAVSISRSLNWPSTAMCCFDYFDLMSDSPAPQLLPNADEREKAVMIQTDESSRLFHSFFGRDGDGMPARSKVGENLSADVFRRSGTPVFVRFDDFIADFA